MFRRSEAYKEERNKEIYKARKNGAKLQELADKYGLNKERIRQICNREERYESFIKYQGRYSTRDLVISLNRKVEIIDRYISQGNTALIDLREKYINIIEIYSSEA